MPSSQGELRHENAPLPQHPLIDRLEQLVGPDVLQITDGSSRWPALGDLNVDGDVVPVALFVGDVARSQRGRDDRERRFQNPGANRPVVSHEPARRTLLLGIWTEDDLESVTRPVLVIADPVRRLGRTTRYSVFVPLGSLLTARDHGWSESSGTDGDIRCLAPQLLPSAFATTTLPASPPDDAVQSVINGSGLLDDPDGDDEAAVVRARRAISTLVRDARFSGRVLAAYDHRCAMCGLGSPVVEGAHIYPASAPGSQDRVWNGLALCANHHRAFDRHAFAVRPNTRQILVRHAIFDTLLVDSAVSFLETTFDQLAEPAAAKERPRDGVFEQRYAYYPDDYDWLS